MLPEIGATELLVIAAVALIVVGPKDLPMLLRKLGSFVARLRGMASEFRSSFDEMARQSELDDLRREVAAMRDAAATEGDKVQAGIDGLNNTIHHDATLSEAGETLTPPVDLETAIYDPESYLRYGAEPAADLPPAAPVVKKAAAKPKASTSKAAKPKNGKAKTAAAKPKTPAAKAAPKTTVTKVAAKAPKPRSPRKAST